MHVRSATAIFLAALPAVAAAQTRPAATRPSGGGADVPVRQVVLFSSGVGYFEHYGTVHGDGTAELHFKARQINDVLKSLVLQDLDGGQVRAVTYPSQDPIAKTLRSFGVNITANPPLAELLNQLRGAKVTVTVGTDDTAGTVLGVEAKTVIVRAKDGDRAVDQHVLNLVSRGKIVAKPLEDVSAIQLDDPRLQDELDKALAALAGARDADKKPVTIRFGGDGDRRVRMGYVVETPVWKTSYRLVLGDRLANGATTRPVDGQLQGWAIVENQTDNDWTDVQLKLVSGRPISFVEDLYQPLYVPRPVVEPDLFASLRPQTYAGGQVVDGEESAAATRPAGPPPVGSADNGVTLEQLQKRMAARRGATQSQQGQSLFQGSSSGGQAGEPVPPMDPMASVRSLASAANAGELFEYAVGSVSLPRQRSAMIPIITDPVEVERVSIYNQSVLPRNPLNGARVKNTTKKLLLAGPITVLDGASYAGDAQVDDVPPGQERLLSYGVDLQVLVDVPEDNQTDQIVTGRIAKGVLFVSHRTRRSKRYVAENKSDRDRQLIVEHPRQNAGDGGGNWKLVESPKPVEQTDGLYRFRVAVPAGKSVALQVYEEQTAEQDVQLLPDVHQLKAEDPDDLAVYRRTGEIPRAVQEALGRLAELRAAAVDTVRQIDAGKQRLTDVTAEQGRLRDNLKAVQPNTKYYDRLTVKLNAQEDLIEKTQAEADGLQKQLERQRQALEQYVAGVNL